MTLEPNSFMREAGEVAGLHHQLKAAIRALQGDPRRPGSTLALIAVEEGWIGTALEHRGQLPGQVEGVLDAGIHALAADWDVDMAGIAGQEGAALAEPLGDPMGRTPARQPAGIAEFGILVAGHLAQDRLQLVQRWLAAVLGVLIGTGAQHAIAPGRVEREQQHQTVLGHIDIAPPGRVRPGQLGIGMNEFETVIALAGKADSETLAHEAMAAVTAEDVIGVKLLCPAIGSAQGDGEAIGRFGDLGDFGRAIDRAAQRQRVCSP